MIVTGQQPAVGGGPLYTLIKIAHAVALARQRKESALFWCASEDHDLGEASHADLVLRDGTIKRCSVALGLGRASLRFRPASAWFEAVFSACHDHLGAGIGSEFLRGQASIADEGMGAWLCRLVRTLFPEVEAIEGHSLRSRWSSALTRALDHWPTDELAELRLRLLREGRGDPFGELAQAPLFVDDASGRLPVTPAQAREILTTGGLDRLSPGAALRPILQQAALPCTAYVGGPGELAYHRFIMPLYAALQVAQPELIPRCSVTLVPTWCARACAALGGSPELPDALRDPPPFENGTSLAAFDEVLRQVEMTPGLSGSSRRLANERVHLARRLSTLARGRAGLPAAGSLRAYLRPRGQLQERTMSLFQALWQFGPGLAPQLVAVATRSQPGAHETLEL